MRDPATPVAVAVAVAFAIAIAIATTAATATAFLIEFVTAFATAIANTRAPGLRAVAPGRCGERDGVVAANGAVALLALGLGGCVFVPQTTVVYDEQCHISARHMELQSAQIGVLANCRNEGCAAVLVGVGAVAAASAVVSGSLVVAGNVVYWFEKQGRCER